MLIFLVSFPANFTNMGTIQEESLYRDFAILSTAMFIVILVHLPLTALFFYFLTFTFLVGFPANFTKGRVQKIKMEI